MIYIEYDGRGASVFIKRIHHKDYTGSGIISYKSIVDRILL